MRNNRRSFLNYKKLQTGKKFKTFTYFSRTQTFYQDKSYNFNLLASSSNVIEEPFFTQFLKIAKKYNRICLFTKAKSLNFNKTSKPNGIRMGKGKGKIKHKIAMVKKNQSLITLREIDERSSELLFNSLKGKVSPKLGFTYQKDKF